jgi:hypothetical protein
MEELEAGETTAQPADRVKLIDTQYPEYSLEYKLQLVHRLLLRRVNLDVIAAQLGVTVRTVQNYRTEILRRMRMETESLDANELIGVTKAFYDEVMGMALRLATSDKIPVQSRNAALRTAMTARKEFGQWLVAAGVFDVIKFKAKKNSETAELLKLVALAEQVIGDEELQLDGLENDNSLLELDDEHVRLL